MGCKNYQLISVSLSESFSHFHFIVLLSYFSLLELFPSLPSLSLMIKVLVCAILDRYMQVSQRLHLIILKVFALLFGVYYKAGNGNRGMGVGGYFEIPPPLAEKFWKIPPPPWRFWENFLKNREKRRKLGKFN